MRVPLVLVVVSSNTKIRLEVELTKTADWLREQVSRVVKRKCFWIVYQGRVVKGDWCLGTYGINSGARLHIVLKQRVQRKEWEKELPLKKKSEALTTALLVLLFSRIVQKERGGEKDEVVPERRSSSHQLRERRRTNNAQQHPLLRWERGQRGVL